MTGTPSLSGTRVLVTGGAGFIGSHVVRALLEAGARVRVLDNLSTGREDNLRGLRVEMVEGDIRNALALRPACRGVEVVFHLAAYISVPGSVADPVTADAVNIGGTLNALMAAREAGVRRVVLSSSAAVYGDTEGAVGEEQSARPLSPYGVEKLYGEHMLRIYALLHGMETASLRYFNVFGPRQNPRSEYAAVIPKFITMMLAGSRPTIFGDGLQTRDFLYVEDVARANLLAATAPGMQGDVLNIAGGRPVSVNDLAQTLQDVLQVDLPPQHGPERVGDIKHSAARVERAWERIGFRAAVDLRAGLEATVAYYREPNA